MVTPSGHYTTNVYHKESAYTCNDNHIMPLNNFEPSDSVYMVFMHMVATLHSRFRGWDHVPMAVLSHPQINELKMLRLN